MSYSPSALPAISAVSVGVTAVDINVPAGYIPKLGALLIQRSTDAGSVYLGFDSGVTTSTGALICKGEPGAAAQYLVPKEVFMGQRTVWLIATVVTQTVDVLIV